MAEIRRESMKNKKLSRIVTALLSVILVLGMITPALADGAVCYVSIRGSSASDQNDGKTPDKPKANFGTLGGNGAVSAVSGGGSIVASGKLYVPKPENNMTYDFPDVGGDVLITASYGGTDYMDKKYIAGEEDSDGPDSGVLKIYPAATMRISGNVTFDDIIIYQEYAQSIIRVASGATVTFGEGVKCFKQKGRDYYMALEVEEGGRVILNGGLFSSISGKGEVVDNRSEADKEISGGNALKPSADPTEWSENTDYIPYETGEDMPVIEYTEPISEQTQIEAQPKDITLWVCIGIGVSAAIISAAVITAFKLKKKK